MIKAMMWIIMVLYGSETWTVNKRIQNGWRLLKCDSVDSNRENQLGRTYNKRRSAGRDWRRKIPDTHNKKNK